MSRWVVPSRSGLIAAVGEPPSGPVDRIVRYVPAEIVIPFTVVIGALASATVPKDTAPKFAKGLIALYLYCNVPVHGGVRGRGLLAA